MIIRHNAHCRAVKATAARILLRHHDSSPKFHELRIRYIAPFSTSPACSNDPIRSPKKSAAKERQRAERDQLIQLVKESPGKRDAKNFLKHFDSPKRAGSWPAAPSEQATEEVAKQAHHDEWRLTRTGVNLGNLYEPAKAIQNSPVFTQQSIPKQRFLETFEPLHIALVKLRQPQAIDEETLIGIAVTLSQMVRLGLNIAVVVDCDETNTSDELETSPAWESRVREQVTRIVDALEHFNQPGAFEVGHTLSLSKTGSDVPKSVQMRGCVEVKNSHLLLTPLEEGIIPVISPIAYDSELRKVRVQADDVLLGLTREFAGLTTQSIQANEAQEAEHTTQKNAHAIFDRPLLDRIIILDPLGGIPSENRADGAHVFINLEAEYKDVKADLQRLSEPTSAERSPQLPLSGDDSPVSTFGESGLLAVLEPAIRPKTKVNPANRHLRNVDVAHGCLRLLPPSSSALVITPNEAAISSQAPLFDAPSTGVRTRRSKNPLIHNLLTDKPMISSSLPAPLVHRIASTAIPNPATFLKKGIPVTIIPELRHGSWQTPSPANPSIDLESDPRIDFPKLVNLIEDSFRRKINVKHYLDRIRGRVAGVIIAGNYEGGAICTWEKATSVTGERIASNSPPESSQWVPYLDKFAVLTQSQGSGGVADIVWGALTRSCFPQGVVWRSRSNNPVNKWYFERAVGMWNLPGGQWTMFWTTEGVVEEWASMQNALTAGNATTWDNYVRVCLGVVPSWADQQAPD